MPPFAFELICSCYFILAVGNTGLVSVLPAIGRSIHIPDAFIAATFSVSGLLFAISSPMWAKVTDRRGRRPLLVLGMSGYMVSMSLAGLVIWAGLWHLAPWYVIVPLLLASRSIFGLLGGAIGPAGQAYVAERVATSERTNAISALAGAQGLGTIIGPLMAPLFILPLVGLSGPLFAFAGIAAVTALLVHRFLIENRSPTPRLDGDAPSDAPDAAEGRRPPPWRDGRIRPFLIYAFAATIAQAVQTQILAFLIIDTLKTSPMRAQGYISIAMMCGAVCGLFAQWGLIRLFKMTPAQLMLWGSGAALIGHLVLIGSQSYWMIVAGYATSCLGFGFIPPGYTAGLSLAVSMREQARVAGILSSLAAVNLVTPLFVLLYHFSGRLPFVINAVGLAAILLYCRRNVRLRTAGAPAPQRDVSDGRIEQELTPPAETGPGRRAAG